MRETRGNFEVEVLRSTGARAVLAWLGARPVSDGPYQPVDAADVRRRDVFGARQDNEFAVRHCCVRKAALCAGPLRAVRAMPPRHEQTHPWRPVWRASETKADRNTNRNFRVFDLSPEKDLQHRLEVLALATDGEERFPMEDRLLNAAGTARVRLR